MVGAMAPRAVRAVADAGRRGLPKAKLSPIFRSRGRLGCPVGFREKWRRACATRNVWTMWRALRFSVAGNLGKVLVMLLAPFLGKPIPL